MTSPAAPDEPCVCGTEFGHDCLAGEHVNRCYPKEMAS